MGFMWVGLGDEARQVDQVQTAKGLEYHLKGCGFILEGVLAEDFKKKPAMPRF